MKLKQLRYHHGTPAQLRESISPQEYCHQESGLSKSVWGLSTCPFKNSNPMKPLVLTSISVLLLSGCMLGTPKIKPIDIYRYEAAHYPGSSWKYLGSEGRWHYFKRWCLVEDHDWKLDRKYLPDLHGFPYYAKPARQHNALPADVEIHAEFIRIHIDGHPPYRIPFKSQGFITAEHRSKSGRKVQVCSQGRDVTQKVNSSLQSMLPAREAQR